MDPLLNELGLESFKDSVLKKIETKSLSPSLIFTGPYQDRKTLAALALAQIFLCEKPQDNQACGLCSSCLKVKEKNHEGVFFLESETETISVESVRDLLQKTYLKKWNKSFFVIIEKAEKLNTYSMNALLKTVEEVPDKSFFIFLTSRLSSLLPTLRSRCQIIRFPYTVQSGDKSLFWFEKSSQALESSETDISELERVRKESFSIFESCVEDSFDFSPFKKVNLDRKNSIQVVRFWMELLKDARFLKESKNLIHEDSKELTQKLKTYFGDKNLNTVFKKTAELEKDLLWNRQISVCFEKYFYQIQELK